MIPPEKPFIPRLFGEAPPSRCDSVCHLSSRALTVRACSNYGWIGVLWCRLLRPHETVLPVCKCARWTPSAHATESCRYMRGTSNVGIAREPAKNMRGNQPEIKYHTGCALTGMPHSLEVARCTKSSSSCFIPNCFVVISCWIYVIRVLGWQLIHLVELSSTAFEARC